MDLYVQGSHNRLQRLRADNISNPFSSTIFSMGEVLVTVLLLFFPL